MERAIWGIVLAKLNGNVSPKPPGLCKKHKRASIGRRKEGEGCETKYVELCCESRNRGRIKRVLFVSFSWALTFIGDRGVVASLTSDQQQNALAGLMKFLFLTPDGIASHVETLRR